MNVCLFDIDGTLLNSGGAGKSAIETALMEEFNVTLKQQVPFAGRTDRAIGRDLLHFHDLPPTLDNWERLASGYLARLPLAMERHNGTILPGIANLLATLADRGVALGLLTGNIRAGAQAKLGHFNLWELFDFGGFGDDHFERDDVARAALRAVQARFDGTVTADRIWVIGDTPLDVSCARAIGAHVVAVATGWHTRQQLAACEPDLLFGDLSNPQPLLDMM